jgi:hypothetical protein
MNRVPNLALTPTVARITPTSIGGGSPVIALEVPVRLGYAWYPGLFRGQRVIRWEE